ncbi:MAG: hypothetical protein KDC98_21030, partial [Planctomycetes bacterium]|nr:hypothetical protein [Planctomycetota bacterium]
RKATPKIRWQAPPAVVDPGTGFVLDAAVLAAVVEPADLALEYEPKAGTRLGPGDHELLVRTIATAEYRAAAARITLTVNPNA